MNIFFLFSLIYLPTKVTFAIMRIVVFKYPKTVGIRLGITIIWYRYLIRIKLSIYLTHPYFSSCQNCQTVPTSSIGWTVVGTTCCDVGRIFTTDARNLLTGSLTVAYLLRILLGTYLIIYLGESKSSLN